MTVCLWKEDAIRLEICKEVIASPLFSIAYQCIVCVYLQRVRFKEDSFMVLSHWSFMTLAQYKCTQ